MTDFGPVIWNSLPADLRNVCDFELFNKAMWK